VVDVFRGKLKGVRTVHGGETTSSFTDEWTRIVKVEGCDYRVSAEVILEWLGLYGEVLSDLVEDVFEDSEDSEGDNTTGIYSVKMRLNQNIPQLLPMDGRRIKIYYRNINKLCTSCFGHHNRRDCKEKKVRWIDYVSEFVESNPQINHELYGKWMMILERENKQKQIDNAHYASKQACEIVEETQVQSTSVNADAARGAVDETDSQSQQDQPIPSNLAKPTLEDFNLPSCEEDWNDVVTKMMALGLSSKEANASLEKRKKLFNAAVKEFLTNNGKPQARKGRAKPRKNSINDVQH
jgi:hypothetical protein